jgi:hypothetical protein
MVSLALPLAHFAASSGVFCLPGTGPVSLTLTGINVQRNANYNGTSHTTQYLRRDRTLQVERIDFEQVSLVPFARMQGTTLVNFKINARWLIAKDAAGKTVCSKEPAPGPQPTGDDCFASSAVPERRGTQGPLEVTWWQCDSGAMGNLTVAAAGSDTLAENMLHYGGLTAFVSSTGSP